MLLAVTYGLGCAAFLVLTVLTLINRRPRGLGLFATLMFAATALWAFLAAMQPWWPPGIAHIADSVHSWMWLQFIAAVLIAADVKGGSRSSLVYRIGLPALGAAAVANDFLFLNLSPMAIDLSQTQLIFRIVLAIVGLLLVENLYRNTIPSLRWHIFPLCIATGFLFAFDLYVFSDAIALRRFDLTLQAVRGLVLVLVAPPLIVTMARNEDWRVDVHVSRRVVLHSATLTAGGIFLIAAAGAASLFGRVPGDWGTVLKITFFCGSLLVLATVVSTERLRSQARRLIAENFFSRRYDYRDEWLRFVATLSAAEDIDQLQSRVIRAVGNVVDSPGGILWLRQGESGVFRPSTSLSMSVAPNAMELADGPLVAKFKNGKQTLEFGTDGVAVPIWATEASPVWLAVPLVHMDKMLGFIVLAPPRAPMKLNWESFDLLRTIGIQVASYLAEEAVTRDLINLKAVNEYAERFAFAGHDVKNLANQLGIMVANIRKFGDDPEFRVDMVRTLENSVQRLDDLLAKLRPDSREPKRPGIVDPAPVIKNVAVELAREGIPIETELLEGDARLKMDREELHSVLTHLVTNAIEASHSGDKIKIRLRSSELRVSIDVEDEGDGMDAAFIRDELFTPLRSTKANGHGIGAYQARELVRGAGGDIEVVSVVNQGTVMRIVMPNAASASENVRQPGARA